MKHRSDAPIVLHGQVVEEVKVFTYLRSQMTTDRDTESEIKGSPRQGKLASVMVWGETERQEAVAVSGNGLMHTMAGRGLS